MEEAHGHPSKATLGVNAADMPGGSRFPFSGRRQVPGDGLATNSYETLTGNLTATAKVPPIGEQFFKYLKGL
jgi:hypothetical protein